MFICPICRITCINSVGIGSGPPATLCERSSERINCSSPSAVRTHVIYALRSIGKRCWLCTNWPLPASASETKRYWFNWVRSNPQWVSAVIRHWSAERLGLGVKSNDKRCRCVHDTHLTLCQSKWVRVICVCIPLKLLISTIRHYCCWLVRVDSGSIRSICQRNRKILRRVWHRLANQKREYRERPSPVVNCIVNLHLATPLNSEPVSALASDCCIYMVTFLLYSLFDILCNFHRID